MSKSKILVVDDELLGRQLLQAVLLPEGYDVILAENGMEAIEMARTQLPNLVLMDVMMPGIDGFETVRQFKSDTELQNIPVILITALDDRDSRINGLEAGAVDYITKPFDRVEIITKVKNWNQDINSHENIKDKAKETEKKKTNDAIEKKISPDTNYLVDEITSIEALNERFSGKIVFHSIPDNPSLYLSAWSVLKNDISYLTLFGPIIPDELSSYRNSIITIWLWKNYHKLLEKPEQITDMIMSEINNSEIFANGKTKWWLLNLICTQNNDVLINGNNTPLTIISNKNGRFDKDGIYLTNSVDNRTIKFEREKRVNILCGSFIQADNTSNIIDRYKIHCEQGHTQSFSESYNLIENLPDNNKLFEIQVEF